MGDTASMTKTLRLFLIAAAAAAFASGCSLNPFGDRNSEAAGSNTDRGGVVNTRGGGQAQIGVNAYLWRASLDTIDFMPLAEVDPFGGVIVTDWYSSGNYPNERFKATVYILDRALRADALKVSVFRQVNQNGSWTDMAADPNTERQIENAILTRARQLRISNIEG